MKHQNNLKAVRLRSGLTGEQLAERSGYSVSMISRWESGQRRLNQTSLKDLAKAMGVPAEDIVPNLFRFEQDELTEKIKLLEKRERELLKRFVDSLLQGSGGKT